MNGQTLQRLRFVPGVVGSFVCGRLGELLESDMPQAYALRDVERTAARVSALFQSSDEVLERCAGVRLSFAAHQLHARRHGERFLCVLTDQSPDHDLLRQATQSVLDQLSAPNAP